MVYQKGKGNGQLGRMRTMETGDKENKLLTKTNFIMRESGYYPAGSEFDPRAPWNECEPEEVTRQCEVWTAVKKTMPIATTNYVSYDPLDDPDLDSVDWKEEYEVRHYDIPELIAELCNLVRKYAPQMMTKFEQRHIRRVLTEAEGWETDEIHVEGA